MSMLALVGLCVPTIQLILIDGVNMAGGHFGPIEDGQHFTQGQTPYPLVDNGIELVTALVAAGIIRQLRVFGQIRPSDGEHEAFEDGIAIGADLHVLAVGTGVDGRG